MIALPALSLLGAALLAGGTAPAVAPEFAVRTEDGVLHVYPVEGSPRGEAYRLDDAVVRARVDPLGDDLWRLRIERAKRSLVEVYFPWQSKREPLDADRSDDIFYQPSRLGMSCKASAADSDFAWKGGDVDTYPGGVFAPFTILADADDARIVSAANWPPRAVLPQFAAERMVLRYSQPVRKGGRGDWTALIARFGADATRRVVPWQLAAGRYRRWLDGHVPRPSHPDWMWRAEGFLNLQLENYIDSPEGEVRRLWATYRHIYPWILFWGQMSPFAGNCCALDYEIHPRYAAWLPGFLRDEVTAKGFHAGLYSSPFCGTPERPRKRLDTKEGVRFLRDWNERHRRLGANSFYVDTLGGTFYGEPSRIRDLFASPTIPVDTLIEGAVDVYPAASLISGALTGYAPGCGAPWKRPEDYDRVGFSRLGRYVLGDRLMFLGASNSDWIFWAEQRGWSGDDAFAKLCGYKEYCEKHGPCEHWTEREAFLLGAKLDVVWPENNPVLDRILALRGSARWWDRRPVYLDTEGLDLSGIPPEARIDVRRHRDRDGIDLLTVYNERSSRDLTMKVDGRMVALPVDNYSIVEVPKR